MVFQDTNGTWEIQGVTSFGPEICGTNPHVFGDVWGMETSYLTRG